LGGQAGITERLDNFPGFPDGIGRGEFAEWLRLQAQRFKCGMLNAHDVAGLRCEMESRCVQTADGTEYSAR
jgi:thioredoxin reductase (NADPH)